MRFKNFDTEQGLLLALQKGDRNAFAVIFKSYHAMLVHYATRLIADQKEAEDIVMDVFLKFLNKTKDFESLANIKAYLMVAVRNGAYSFLRSEGTKNKRSAEFLYLSEQADRKELDLDRMNAEVIHAIFAEIEKLPPKSRKVFLLKIVTHQDNNQIAATLGITPKTVRNQLSIAIRKLKNVGFINDLSINILVLGIFLSSTFP